MLASCDARRLLDSTPCERTTVKQYSLCDGAFLGVVHFDSDLRANVQVFPNDGHSGSSGTRTFQRFHGHQLWDLETFGEGRRDKRSYPMDPLTPDKLSSTALGTSLIL